MEETEESNDLMMILGTVNVPQGQNGLSYNTEMMSSPLPPKRKEKQSMCPDRCSRAEPSAEKS